MKRVADFIKKYQIQITFLLTVLFFIPLNTYLNNLLEVNCEAEIARDIMIAFVVLGALFLVFNKIFKEKCFEIFNVIVLFITLQLFIQGNFINYNLGVLNGIHVNWVKYYPAIWIETSFWVVLFILFIVFRTKILEISKKLCLFIIIFQLFLTMYSAHKIVKDKMIPSKKEAAQEYKNRMASTNAYTFSKKNNVLILVIDAMPSDLFEDALKSQDGDKIREDFKDFTFYTKSIGRFPTTMMSVPFIQSGVPYDNSVTMDEFKNNNQKYFIQNKLDGYEYHDNMSPYFRSGKLAFYNTIVLRHAPILVKYLLSINNLDSYNIGNSQNEVQYYNKLRENISFTEKPVYKYLHIVGTHPGARMNRDITFNPNATLEDTAVANLKIMKYILDKLKEEKVYDNSMIFIIADHGLAPTNIRRKYSRPMFLFKNYNTTQDSMKISEDFVSLGDIPNTIFDQHKIPLNPYGLSILRGIPQKRVVEFCSYDWAEQTRKAALSKNHLPPLTCVNFTDGNMLNYTLDDAVLKNKRTIFEDDIEKILYSEHYFDNRLHCICTGDNSYIRFYLGKNNHPKENIKIKINIIGRADTVKRVLIQDDNTKEIVFEDKYKKNKPKEIYFEIPKSAIKDDGEVKLNLLADKLKEISEQKYGFYLGKIEIDIN